MGHSRPGAQELGAGPGSPVAFRIRSLDFRTIWAARELETALGWRPLIDAAIEAPGWLRWGRATGAEPLLDAAQSLVLTRADLAAPPPVTS